MCEFCYEVYCFSCGFFGYSHVCWQVDYLVACLFGDGALAGGVIVSLERGLGCVEGGFEPVAEFNAGRGGLFEGFFLFGYSDRVLYDDRVHNR